MTQKELMKLLKEAASAKCAQKQRNRIKKILVKAADDLEDNSADVEHVFSVTAKDRPKYLIGLFPYFALLCCESENPNEWNLKIDWSLMDNNKKKNKQKTRPIICARCKKRLKPAYIRDLESAAASGSAGW